jgi:hypothetical protein
MAQMNFLAILYYKQTQLYLGFWGFGVLGFWELYPLEINFLFSVQEKFMISLLRRKFVAL